MARSFYTVSFLSPEAEYVSRYFSTIHAARNWAKWLESQPFANRVTIYRGQAGGEVVAGA